MQDHRWDSRKSSLDRSIRIVRQREKSIPSLWDNMIKVRKAKKVMIYLGYSEHFDMAGTVFGTKW